jgi:arsenate reductase
MKKAHGINMEKSQYSKLFEEIPEADIVVSMGCNVVCPSLPGKLNFDWGLEDPTGQSDEKFIEIIEMIEKNMLELRETIIKMDN